MHLVQRRARATARIGDPHRDSLTGADLIAFDECPFSGEITETEHGTQIAFPWPRNRTMRHAIGDWLTHYGINFTVVM